MVVELEDGMFDIYVKLKNIVISPANFKRWIKLLKDNRNLKYLTLKRYSHAINKFITWTLYKPREAEESLLDYLLRYRKDFLLECNSIIVEDKYDDGEISFTIERIILTNSTKSFNSINLEMSIIESYFTFLKEIGASSDSLQSDEIDWLYEKNKSSSSVHSGYGLAMRDSLLEIYGKKKSILRPLKTNNSGNEDKFFPFYFFYELLDMSEPQEKLLYLLCGGAGARVGQALSLTWLDIDYENREVYLIDPRSDMYSPLLEIPRISLLKERYNINPNTDKPHADIAFKYPIPLEYGPLTFITHYLESEVFKTFRYIVQIPEYVAKHPFVFTTSTGNRLSVVQANRLFTKRLKQLKEKYPLNPEDENYFHIRQLHKAKGIHSLRHMFAVAIADIGLSVPEIGIDTARALTQNMLGHKNPASTEVYFKVANLAKKYYKSIIKEIEDGNKPAIAQLIEYMSLRQTKKGNYHYGKK
ncbi:MAG: tyrosine-type recombinase/integrase [Sulfurimonas sp.]|jgi:integrase